MNHKEQKKAAKQFAKKWENKGYEKGESAPFWLSLLSDVFGVKKPDELIRFEDRVILDHTSFIDGYIPSTNVLIEQKSIDKDLGKAIRQSDGSLLTPFQQAKRYSAELRYSERPRWVVLSNFKEIRMFDMENPTGEPEVLYLKDLENEYYRLAFLLDKDDDNIKKAKEASMKAGELVGVLYSALLKEYDNPESETTLHDLNALCVRLVFCFYAEDSGLFGRRNMFYDYLNKRKGINFRDALIKLFKILDQNQEDRDQYLEDDLAAFPYVNGGLFENKNFTIPRINEEIIDIILNQASVGFDWSKISPTIFGGVFESTLNPETRRSGGMHYTSTENIHKVIDPLFMDELNEEFEEIKSLTTIKIRDRKLKEFQNKIASFKFLDPAAGSGNFLTETYITLRKMENNILELLYGIQSYGLQIVLGVDVLNPVKVSINQFYGIEINDFAVTVATTALWIAESQMLQETEDIIRTNLDFLPIKNDAKIVEGNALRMNWNDVVDSRELNFIMGNPPFIGARLMEQSQKEDTRIIFGKTKGANNLDYVSNWYKKATKYINDTSIQCAFVSTNSITQGEQVSILWEKLFNDYEISINFAYRTFKWGSEASSKAHVHCVIIGFSQENKTNKYIYVSENRAIKAKNINAYLVDGPNVFIRARRESIVDISPMSFGSMANDGGNLILSDDEKKELISYDESSEKYIRPFLGAKEFINKINRWCLWIKPHDLKNVIKIKPIRNRIQKVKENREESKRKSTRELADYPYAFGEIRQSQKNYLLVPRVSSENRKYIPIGYVDANTIASDAVLIVSDASISHFAIMCSNVHMAWVRTVAGRLESRYRYSASIVYNNFPWLVLKPSQVIKLEKTGQMILKARSLYPDWSYADLYNELIMPPELRKAHQENDKAVMEVYGFDWRKMTESESVAELMKLYKKIIEIK